MTRDAAVVAFVKRRSALRALLSPRTFARTAALLDADGDARITLREFARACEEAWQRLQRRVHGARLYRLLRAHTRRRALDALYEIAAELVERAEAWRAFVAIKDGAPAASPASREARGGDSAAKLDAARFVTKKELLASRAHGSPRVRCARRRAAPTNELNIRKELTRRAARNNAHAATTAGEPLLEARDLALRRAPSVAPRAPAPEAVQPRVQRDRARPERESRSPPHGFHRRAYSSPHARSRRRAHAHRPRTSSLLKSQGAAAILDLHFVRAALSSAAPLEMKPIAAKDELRVVRLARELWTLLTLPPRYPLPERRSVDEGGDPMAARTMICSAFVA